MPEEVFISKEDLRHYFSEQNMYLSDSTRAKIRKPQTKNHVFSFGGKYISKTFMDWMYEDAHIYLRRKFDIYQNWLEVR